MAKPVYSNALNERFERYVPMSHPNETDGLSMLLAKAEAVIRRVYAEGAPPEHRPMEWLLEWTPEQHWEHVFDHIIGDHDYEHALVRLLMLMVLKDGGETQD